MLCLGLDSTIEGEQGDAGNEFSSGDKSDMHYPKCQRILLEKILKIGKPIILISLTGSAMDMCCADEGCAAVVQAWYPGAEGGTAIAELLFGKFSPSGKLLVTVYKSTEDLPKFTDYSMKERTYRYFNGTPLYPFGYGLSYTKFKFEKEGFGENNEYYEFKIKVSNVGGMDAYAKIQAYAEPNNCEFVVPRYELRAIQPVFVKMGESEYITLRITKKSLYLTNNNGEKLQHKGGFTIYIGGGQPDLRTRELTGEECVKFEI